MTRQRCAWAGRQGSSWQCCLAGEVAGASLQLTSDKPKNQLAPVLYNKRTCNVAALAEQVQQRVLPHALGHLSHPQRAAGKLGRRQRHALPLPSLLAAPLALALPPAIPPAVSAPIPLPLPATRPRAAPPRRRAAAVCRRAGPRGRPRSAAGGRPARHGRTQDAWPPRPNGCHRRLRHCRVSEHQQQTGPARWHLRRLEM